ncbi:hypothetical protein BS78_10G038600 [Paspalum vaginatum]|nr:hypothetical protein BS78_10G038600 [Paspalum vaginatum]
MGVTGCLCLDAVAFVTNAGGQKSKVCLNKSVSTTFPRADPIIPTFIRLHLGLLFVSTILLKSALSVPDLAPSGPDQDSAGVDLCPHTTSAQPSLSINDSTYELNFVFLDVALEGSRPFRVRWKPHVHFADEFHPHPRFGRDDGPLRLQRPVLPPLVRPPRPGSKRPWCLWYPTPTANSTMTPLMTPSLGRVFTMAPFL